MLTRTLLPVLLLVSVCAHSLQKPLVPNPCGEQQSQAEMNRCAAWKYKKAEAALNARYEALIFDLEKDVNDARRKSDAYMLKYSETGLNELKDAERAWLRYRDLHCKAAEQRFEGGSMSPAVWSDCMQRVTEHRIDELTQAYEKEGNE